MTAATPSAALLYRPRVRYTGTDQAEFDAMMTWRAELELSYLDETGNEVEITVVGGHAEFLVISVGQAPVIELLDSLDRTNLAVLFDGDDVAPAVQEQFPDATFNRALIVTDVEIAAPLRGNGLGAWLVAELVERIASPTDTLVLLHPSPAEPPPSRDAELAAARALSRYWQQFGLSPIEHHPEFLGAATAYAHLARARDALRALDEVVFPVPQALIGRERPTEPRHTVIADEPHQHVGLRLVRT
jgi:GNAT superfamily N-acetyltransferase